MTMMDQPTTNDKGMKDQGVRIRLSTFNIRNGRAGNLEGALRAMEKMKQDIFLLTEVKQTDERYTKKAFGFDVIATKAKSKHRGGVALIYRESAFWQIESVQQFGPNVIGFVLVTGKKRYSCVGGVYPSCGCDDHKPHM